MAALTARLVSARVYLPLVAIVVASAALSAAYALQAQHWVVMTDELQTSKLATSVARTGSPLPQIHGRSYGPPSQLYPLLLAPFFGFLSVPAAVDAAHALNALLLASAAWPAFLLGRAVTGSRAGGLFAAALSAFVPWLVLSTTLLTENAAYPASVWCLFLAHRTVAAPSRARDAAAAAGLALAVLARTQLVVLALVVPIAILVHELARAAAAAPAGGRLDALRAGARSAVTSHAVLVVAYGVAAAVATALVAVAGPRGVLGTYADVLQGELVPAGLARAAVEHLDYLAVGVGGAPLLLACAWAVAALVRPDRRAAHAFAVLLLVTLPVIVLQAASFDLRFAAGAYVQDRYLMYLAPVLAVGAAAALLERERRGLRAALVLASGVVLAALAAVASFPPAQVIFWASPASAFQRALATVAASVDLSVESLVQTGAVALGGALAVLVWRAPRIASLAAVGAAVVAFCIAEVVYVFDRLALPITIQDDTIANVDRDWIDRLPGAPAVALVPYAYLPPDVWWDAAFWNKSVDRVVEVYGPTFVPFPVDRLRLDLATGTVTGLPDRDLVLAQADTRLRLTATTTLFTAPPLTVVRVRRPARAEWSTRGAEPDGWTTPGGPVKIRFYAAGSPGARDVRVALAGASETPGRLPFTITFAGGERRGRVGADKVSFVDFPVCVPRGGFAEATLLTPRGVRIRDGRVVGLHLDAIDAPPTGRSC